MDKTDRLRDYGLAFLLYEQGLGICGYGLIRELFIFIKLILNSYLDLDKDPFETHDLSATYPDKVEELESKWIEWANTHKVFPLEDKIWTERINFYHEKNSYQKGDY